MEFLLILIFIVVLAVIAGKSLFGVTNPGSKFYDRVNGDKNKKS